MRSKSRKNLLKEVQNTIEEHDMLKGVKKCIIAFSSGPDSVCLLDMLHKLYAKKIKFSLVYINHSLRPQRILKLEENLTKKYASKYNIDYKIVNVKVKKKKIGIEAAAREIRYNALSDYMKKIGAQRICLGHNLDDMLETFFMNLLRGSGTRGLKSIPPKRLPFIRPLINLKKQEILKFLKRRRLFYSLDKTNIRLDFRRNLLRHKIIPELAKINPEIHQTIKREIEILRKDDEYLEKQAKKIYENIVKIEKTHVSLDIKRFLRYNPSIRSRVVMKTIKGLHGNLNGYESKHFDDIIGLKDRKSGKKITLPKGLYAQREYGNIVIGIAKPVKPQEISVDIDSGSFIFSDYIIRTRIVPKFKLKNLRPNCEIFDLSKIEPPLFIRNRKEGDYIKTKIGKKKIKKIFNEYRIPLHKRSETMILCDQKDILWVLGVLRAFRGFIDKNTKNILVVEFEHIT